MSYHHEYNNSQSDIVATSNDKQGVGFFVGFILALILAIVAFFSGFTFGNNPTLQSASLFSIFAFEQKLDSEDRVDMREFWRVWDLMEEKFAVATSTDIPTDLEKIEGAINGMIRSYGDSYSVYLPPKEAESFNEDISGNFGGVGMEVGMREGIITIIAPLPKTPAESAGIQAGDILVRIDGQSTESMNINEAVELIRGEKGTEVVLTIAREGEMEFIDISITRDTISIPTVDTEIVDDVFVIRLYSFNAIAEAKMQNALREYVRSGKDKLILDLRSNPGGFLHSAVSVASYFLPTGKPIVIENFGDGRKNRVFRSQGRTVQDFTVESMVVLVDRGSASASEIVAGALSEHGIATVIGTDTFGKGSVQELVRLQSGASLKVTVARWLTPKGVSISEGGISPDYDIKRTHEQRLDGDDPQLRAAVDYLNGVFDYQEYATSESVDLDESE